MSIVTETVTVREKEYTRTYSDEGYYIQNESGELFSEAVDPFDSGRAYTETTEEAEAEAEEITDSEALNIIIGTNSEVNTDDAE